MADQRIDPASVTKPIQLLAAWFVGLILVNGSLLTGAATITEPIWIPALLAIAAVANVPLFLGCLFLLQTRFRPEMQEDTYYSRYLESKNAFSQEDLTSSVEVAAIRTELVESNTKTLDRVGSIQDQVSQLLDLLSSAGGRGAEPARDRIRQEISESARQIEVARQSLHWSRSTVAVNDLLTNYDRVREALAERGIPVNHTFGSSSKGSEIPPLFTVSFGEAVPAEHVREVLRALKGKGVQAVSYAPQEYAAGTLYIGSYAYKHRSVAKLTPELWTSIVDSEAPSEVLVTTIQRQELHDEQYLMSAMDRLPEREAKILRLTFGNEGHTLAEAANMFGISPGAATELLLGAQQRLGVEVARAMGFLPSPAGVDDV